MRKRHKISGASLIVVTAGISAWLWQNGQLQISEVKEIEDIPPIVDLLIDDRLEDKKPPFDSEVVDSRLVESYDESQREVNASAAVLKLDIGENRSDEPLMNTLFASYADAARILEENRKITVLPSINSIDGAAKQFDDGLMAAVTLAMAGGGNHELPDIAGLLQACRDRAESGTAAREWLSVALFLGDHLSKDEKAGLSGELRSRAKQFRGSADGKPLGFFGWNSELKNTWLLLKFLQQPLNPPEADQLTQLLRNNSGLAEQYTELLLTVGRLSNPTRKPGLLTGQAEIFLPPAGMKEDHLFDRLYRNTGVPPGIDLMHSFVKAIRDGTVNLQPRGQGGWYDHQIHTLETFLMPERGAESDRLMLTKRYKQRMLEAFKSIVTVRRELHSGLGYPTAARAAMPLTLEPRLRVEPNPTYFLRMARSYRFISGVLRKALAIHGTNELVGLREDGRRDGRLADELERMTRRFYGLHLVSCEDIGMRPELRPDEPVDRERAMSEAVDYLKKWRMDPDMSADVRVSTPVLVQPTGYRLWCKFGVRPAKLFVSYVRPPSTRRKGGDGKWIEAIGGSSRFIILVDEFAEVHAPLPLDRAELRAACDEHVTKDQILKSIDHRLR